MDAYLQILRHHGVTLQGKRFKTVYINNNTLTLLDFNQYCTIYMTSEVHYTSVVKLMKRMNNIDMKWLRYQRVIILKIQVGNRNQRNKWANTDTRI
jgi:hypothetical protein